MTQRIRIGRVPVRPEGRPAAGENESLDKDKGEPLSCPKSWDALAPTAAPGVRHCPDCREDVFEVGTPGEMDEAARLQRCIAVADDVAGMPAAQALPATPAVHRRLTTVTLLVRDYDEAIRFFTEALRFELVEDTPRGPGKRWVVVAPAGPAGGAALLLARAADEAQAAAVGHQAGGRVFMFLHTQDFAADHAHMRAHGVRFLEEPRQEPHGTVAVFLDLCGNRWDLLQPA